MAVMLNVLLVGAAGWALTSLVERSRSRAVRLAARTLFFALLLLPLNALRAVLANRYSYLRSPLFDLLGTRGVLLLAAALGATALIVVLRWPEQLVRASRAVLLILSPMVLLTFAQALWRAATYDASEFRDHATAPPLGQKRAPRVLWVVLDEWDQRLTFVNRPAGLQLPELDRLRRESFHADNAAPPGPETLLSHACVSSPDGRSPTRSSAGPPNCCWCIRETRGRWHGAKSRTSSLPRARPASTRRLSAGITPIAAYSLPASRIASGGR